LLERAEAEGLVDVAYAETDTPVGRLLVAATPRGLVRVSFHGERMEDVLAELSERISPRVLLVPAKLDEARRELDQYFEGSRHRFELPLDWALAGSPFRRRVLERTAMVPYGETISYRDAAAGAGNERAVRAAGTALGANPIPIVVPCHRVLRSGGQLGGYGGGLEAKRYLLDLEAGRLSV
jgi:methylated-DNA-[protein]-cysteine S-methyltransferase